MHVSLRNLQQKELTDYTCPYSNVTLCGSCPVTACPANMVKLTKGEQSGCFYVIGSVDLAGFIQHLNLPAKIIKQRIELGKTNIQAFIDFYNLISELREQAADKNQHPCPHCGVLNKHPGKCFNELRCNSRNKFAQRVKQRYPFNIPNIGIDNFAVWLYYSRYKENPTGSCFLNEKQLLKAHKLTERLI